MTIRVIRPGALTTVQDRGRFGWQRDGVPVSGAMDDVAFRVANWLVGNRSNEAALEATLTGPALQFAEPTAVAVTGADMDARINGHRLPPWHARRVNAGDTLTLDGARRGCRAYVAVAGGIVTDPVLGSRSTYARAKLGGHQGRVLRRDDVLRTAPVPGDTARTWRPRGVDVGWLHLRRQVARIIAGPHLAMLSAASRRELYTCDYTLSPESDRMGLRFHGEPLRLQAPVEILSGAVAMGTVQLPPGGVPIVLMADRQTTGGYPRLGEVATVDLPVLAQLRPGDHLRFAEIPHAEAEALHLERERELARLCTFLLTPS